MADKHKVSVTVSDRALEMVMRDVLDSLSELSLESGFKPSDGGFDIIEIYPPNRERTSRRNAGRWRADHEEGEVLQFPDLRRATG
jgi:hypothetical protein